MDHFTNTTFRACEKVIRELASLFAPRTRFTLTMSVAVHSCNVHVFDTLVFTLLRFAILNSCLLYYSLTCDYWLVSCDKNKTEQMFHEVLFMKDISIRDMESAFFKIEISSFSGKFNGLILLIYKCISTILINN